MTSLRRFILKYEDNAPALFNWLRYILHVVIMKDTVYPTVTKKIFKIIDSQTSMAIDVGANVGVVTRYFSRHFAITHAIEPLPYLSARLKQLENNRIKVHQCAVGAEDGEITIRTPIGFDGQLFHALSTASKSNTLSMFKHEKEVTCTVPLKRLSTIISEAPLTVGYLKIDVEGFEYEVMLGATDIVKDRPLIQIEISKLHNPKYELILSFFNEKNYVGFSFESHNLADDMLNCIASQSISTNQTAKVLTQCKYQFLFIPNEKMHMFKHLIIESTI